MDYYSILAFVSFIVISALVVVIISFFGTREKTYEEAIAEQKQKAQEIALQTKTEKPVKEKKKKHVRKSKEKNDKENEKEDALGEPIIVAATQSRNVSESSDKAYKTKHAPNLSRKVLQVDNANGAKEMSETNHNRDVGYTVPETKMTESVATTKKQEKKEKREDARVKPLLEEKQKDTVKPDEKEKTKGTKGGRATDDNKGKDEVIPKKESEVKAKSKSHGRGDEGDDGLENMIASKREEKENVKNNNKTEMKIDAKKEDTQATSSPAKKNKKSKSEFGYGDGIVNGTRLAAVMKNAILTDPEIQTLIEILLNRQQEGESWVKPGQKADPLSTTKKQLQEAEQALTNEKQLSQSTSSKLKEVRQELSRSNQMERSLREKMTTITQELQVLQAHMQRTLEQHGSEIESLQLNFQQVQGKMEEDHRSAIQQLQDENEQLQNAVAQLEAETNNVTSAEIARLQHEVEQWRATTEQLQAQLATAQHAEHELALLQQRLQDVENGKAQCEGVYEQRIGEMVSQLQQLELERNSIQNELCHMQTIQSENASLLNQVHCMEQNAISYQQTVEDLNSQLIQATEDKQTHDPETENRLIETTKNLEHLHEEMKNKNTLIDKLQEDTEHKDSRISQLQEDITQLTCDVQRLTDEVATQQEKNNERIDEEVKKVQETVRTAVQRIFPDISQSSNLEFHDWLQRLESDAKTLVAPSAASESEDLKTELSQAKETESTLRSQVQHYKDILQETESMLHRLQRSVEEEETTWKQRLLGKEAEVQQLIEDKKVLEEKKSALENSLEEIKAAEEMQEKLKELQSKLQSEENERRLLEGKFTEASKNASDLQKQLDDTRNELELVRTEQTTVEEHKRELEIQLDKEKKHTKELTTNNVKLNSLVRIGQDSLKAEQDVVFELQKQLSELKTSTTNGSACPTSVPIEAASNKK